ncbi:MAG: RNA polymerase sigma factor [Phycisphaerales bacterium]
MIAASVERELQATLLDWRRRARGPSETAAARRREPAMHDPEGSMSTLREAHAAASERWPGVSWSFERYAAHVGEDRPPHLTDLYLGGAGGWRRDGAWAAIHDEISGPLELRLRRQPCGTHSPEDLVSESIAALMGDDPEASPAEAVRPSKLVRYRGRTSLVNYFLVVAKRIAIGSHRRRREHAADMEAIDPVDRRGDSMDPERGVQFDRLAEAIRQAYDALSARQRFLLAMIHGQGMPKAQAGELVGLPPWGVSRELEKIHDHMRLALERSMPEDWDHPSREAWASAWQRCFAEAGSSGYEVEATKEKSG